MIPDGIHPGLPAADYHADPALGSGDVKTLATKSALHYRHRLGNPKPASGRMDLGSLIHCMMLEPDHVDDRFVVQPADIKTRRGAAWDEFVVTVVGSRTVVKGDDWGAAWGALAALEKHPIASVLLAGRRECSAFWTDENGVRCKARFDALPDVGEVLLMGEEEAVPVAVPCADIMVDLKSTADAHPRNWRSWALERLQYHCQAGAYRRVLRGLGEPRQRWVFVVVEQQPPHAVACYELTPASIAAGEALSVRACRQYAASVEFNDWPGYGHEIRPVSVSTWAIEAAHAEVYEEPEIENLGF